jgi:hypothetical protein
MRRPECCPTPRKSASSVNSPFEHVRYRATLHGNLVVKYQFVLAGQAPSRLAFAMRLRSPQALAVAENNRTILAAAIVSRISFPLTAICSEVESFSPRAQSWHRTG